MTAGDVFHGLNTIKGHLLTACTVLALIGGASWTVAKPYVDGHILTTVQNSKSFASAASMSAIDSNMQQMKIDIDAIGRRLEEGESVDDQIKRQLQELRLLNLETQKLILRTLDTR